MKLKFKNTLFLLKIFLKIFLKISSHIHIVSGLPTPKISNSNQVKAWVYKEGDKNKNIRVVLLTEKSFMIQLIVEKSLMLSLANLRDDLLW